MCVSVFDVSVPARPCRISFVFLFLSAIRSVSAPVVAIDAEHNDDRALKLAPDQFRQLRTRVHLAAGARVMLTSNQLWDVRTVQSGLMNGARAARS